MNDNRSITAADIDDMTRDALIAWLTWNDPNGIYTDRDNEAEGYPPMTHTELQLTALSQLEG